jgi:hypothetical protein
VRFIPAESFTNGHSLNGGGGAATFFLTKSFGIKADFQGYQSNTSFITIPVGTPGIPGGAQVSVSGDLFTYMFGPEYKFHFGRFQPFGEALFGGAHSNAYGNAYVAIGPGAFTVGGSPANNAFAMAYGGGLDIKLSRHIAFRPGEFDYLYTDFSNQFVNNKQNNFRYTAGMVFTF